MKRRFNALLRTMALCLDFFFFFCVKKMSFCLSYYTYYQNGESFSFFNYLCKLNNFFRVNSC